MEVSDYDNGIHPEFKFEFTEAYKNARPLTTQVWIRESLLEAQYELVVKFLKKNDVWYGVSAAVGSFSIRSAVLSYDLNPLFLKSYLFLKIMYRSLSSNSSTCSMTRRTRRKRSAEEQESEDQNPSNWALSYWKQIRC